MSDSNQKKPKDGWDQLPPDIRDDTIMRFFRELSQVKDNHRLLVLVAHGFIELLINTLVESKCKHGKRVASSTRDYPHSAKLVILNEIGVLSDHSYRSLDWLRRLRNKAAHEPFFTITRKDLQQLREEFRDPDRFHDLCIRLVGGIWNENIQVLGPVFGPNVTGTVKTPRG